MQEQFVKKYRANRYHHLFNADGGSLTITNMRLRFEAHAINFNTAPSEILLANIVRIETFNALLIVPNGIIVVTSDGKRNKFVVNKRKEIMQLIQSLLPH